MRKIVAAFVLLIFSFSALLAQDSSIPKNRTGFKAGANYSTQSIKISNQKSNLDYRFGLAIGLFREIMLNNQFTFQPEILFNSLGAKNGDAKIRLNYLSIPLLIKMHGKNFGVYAGPQTSLLLSAKQKTLLNPDENLKNSYKSVDLSGIVGVECSFGEKNRFVVSGHYQIPFTNVWKDQPGTYVKNSSFQLTAGFRFK